MSKKSPKKLFLLDAFALIYRSYFAFIRNPRFNSSGLNTSAMLGFTNTLMQVLETEKPDYIGVAFDVSRKTFRNDMYEAYKAHREEMPEDLRKSIPYIRNIIKAFNIPILELEGFEADDIIGTLSKEAEKKGFQTYMMTPDKDYAQLVSDNIFMYKPGKAGNDAEVWDIEKIQENFGIDNPEQVIDILGLMGDSADNIPGCPGIGPKNAQKLIAQYGSIKGLYEHINEIKGKQKENLETYKDQVLLSRKLAVIILDVPFEFNPENLKKESPNIDELSKIFNELEFKTLAQRLKSEKPVETAEQGLLFGSELNTGTIEPENKFETIESVPHQYYL
ncbi:MAG: DNA polymerase I, partial [Mariniphaga sp.]|nr:DNA polymerase I [Mariniphaga sp.]